MARELTAAALSAILASRVRPALLYEGAFVSGTLRLWTGLGELQWDGRVWTGAGKLLAVSPITESGALTAIGFRVALSGELQQFISLALGQSRHGLPGRVWFALFDDESRLIVEPYLAFAGRLDAPTIDDPGGEGACTISVAYESRLIDLRRARARRYTPEDQRIDYPTDRGFDFVASLQDTKLPWGKQ